MNTISETRYAQSAREMVDSRRILDALLRRLVQKVKITREDLDTILGTTIRNVLDAVQAQMITVFMVEGAEKQIAFRYVYYASSLYKNDPAKKALYEKSARQLEQVKLEFGVGIVGQTILTGEPVLVENAKNDPRFYGSIDQLTGFETQSILAVPLKTDAKVVVGCVEVINKCLPEGRVGAFTRQDMYLVSDVANYSAKVIHRVMHPDQPFPENEMLQFLARYAHIKLIELDENTKLDLELIRKVGIETLKHTKLFPLARLSESGVRVALSNPLDIQAITDFEALSGLKVEEKVAAQANQISEAIERAFPQGLLEAELLAKARKVFGDKLLAEESDDGKESQLIITLSLAVVRDAYQRGASDIHIEAHEDKTEIRYRIEGICRNVADLPLALHTPLVARFKVMAELDICEHRMPQDGRIAFNRFAPEMDLDLRVAIAPMYFGPKVCLRLVDRKKAALSLDKLGFSPFNLERYREAIQAPYGMVLHCGPTGSGKSLTLASALNELNKPGVVIATAEDPVEHTLPGLNQMQIRRDLGLTFASALRSFLRQDPDLIFVGEIRDEETAEMALQAALTGHLLFSTLHTNDAASTISRLVEMGLPPYMVSAALLAVCAQRLLRRLCPYCKQESPPTGQELALLSLARDEAPIGHIYRPGECARCGHSGYKGLTGIHELMVLDDELRELVSQNARAHEIKRLARKKGMRTLFEDAMEKVKLGVTSLPEALGTVQIDDPEAHVAARAVNTPALM